jgi:hypothetical protein
MINQAMLSLSWTEGALSERETCVGYNYWFQPPSAGVHNQDKKRPFRRWIIAAVIIAVIIIAVIGGYYLHWRSTYPTLRASYSGDVGTMCNPLAVGPTGTISLDHVVEDHTNGTFTGRISELEGCGLPCSGAVHGTVTPSGNVRFTYVVASDDPLGCGNKVSFSGTIQSRNLFSWFSLTAPADGEIDGQIYYPGAILDGIFHLRPASLSTPG